MLIAALLAAAVGATAPPAVDRSTPARTAATFYAWHAHSAVTDDLPGMRRFFTPALADGLAWVTAAQECTRSAILDYDPFGGAQVGITSYAVGATTMHGSSARVTMKLRLWKNMATTATLVLQHGGDGWRIADAIDDSGTSVAKVVRDERAQVPHYSRITPAQRACLARIPY